MLGKLNSILQKAFSNAFYTENCCIWNQVSIKFVSQDAQLIIIDSGIWLAQVVSWINKLCSWMGTIYPRSDHYPPYPEIFKHSYFAVIGGTTQVKNPEENLVIRKIPALFCPMEGQWGKTNSGNPISAKYWATRGLKLMLGTQNWIGVKRLTAWG